MSWFEWDFTWKKIDELQNYVRQRFNKLEEKMAAQVDEVNLKLDDLDQKTNEAADRLKQIIAAIQPGMSQAEVDAIKNRIQTESDRLATWGQSVDNPLP